MIHGLMFSAPDHNTLAQKLLNVTMVLLVILAAAVSGGCDRDDPPPMVFPYSPTTQPASGNDEPQGHGRSVVAARPLPAKFTKIGNSGVSLRLPDDAMATGQTNTYVSPSSQAVIVVTQVPVGPGKLLEEFKNNDNQDVSHHEQIKIGDMDAHLVTGRKRNYAGVWFKTLTMFFGQDNGSTMIVGGCPESEDDSVIQMLAQCLKTARWDPNAVLAPLDQLGFSIKPSANLKLGGVMPGAQAIVFRESGKPKPQNPGEGIFLVMYTKLPEPPADRREWFDFMIASDAASARHSNVKVESVREIKVSGLAGYEAVCTAYDDQDKLVELFYVAALFRSDSEFYRIWGQVRLDQRKVFEPEFKSMTRSFKLKQLVTDQRFEAPKRHP